jgi:tRNA (guanine26-N2/guanine27-N2)-dimethyltransferase
VKVVYANDILPAAAKLMKDNFELNALEEAKFRITLKDANVLLRDSVKEGGLDIIDLDPYGSVVPFLDSALGSIKNGGLLCITCTDTRVLCGPDLTKCFYYYGTTRAKVHDFNENALRILLSTISSSASRHCKYISPLLSLQTDFYVRVFVRVFEGKRECG